MTNNSGYTETAGEKPLVSDPLDQRLEAFTGTTDASRTVTVISMVWSRDQEPRPDTSSAEE